MTDEEKNKYKGEYTAIRVDIETARMLKRIASANDRTMLAQARAIIKREYAALEKRTFEPADEKPAREYTTKKTETPAVAPTEKPEKRKFLWWFRRD